jgi:hypothetical protein
LIHLKCLYGIQSARNFRTRARDFKQDFRMLWLKR